MNEVVDMQEVELTSAVASNKLLAQDGWTIIRQLQTALLESINQTGLFTLPVTLNLDEYIKVIKDPEGFNARFATLTNDLMGLMVTAKSLGDRIGDKTGKPTEDELEIVGKITLDLTRLQGYIENTVHPLIIILADELEQVGINDLTV